MACGLYLPTPDLIKIVRHKKYIRIDTGDLFGDRLGRVLGNLLLDTFHIRHMVKKKTGQMIVMVGEILTTAECAPFWLLQ